MKGFGTSVELQEMEPRSRVSRSAVSAGGNYAEVDLPDDDFERYQRAFETIPIIRQPLISFANEVWEAGYFVSAPSKESQKKAMNWLRKSAILEGDVDRDFGALGHKVTVQTEIRGTVPVEHVGESMDSERIVGMKLMKPEDVTFFTEDDRNVLLAPDADADAPQTPTGKTAAYGQFHKGGTQDPAYFARDEVTKIVRDADISALTGNSRLEPVVERAEALIQKLSDNDQAIAGKAYPFWLFKMGTEEDPWSQASIEEFMDDQDPANYSPGQKTAVSGDVNIETISGEVAEIIDTLEYETKWILSTLPIPQTAMPLFGDRIGNASAKSQELNQRRMVKRARRRLEKEFTPILRKKAEQENWGEKQEFELRIGPPNEEEEAGIEDRVSTIKYVGSGSDSDDEGGDGGSVDEESSDDSEDGDS